MSYAYRFACSLYGKYTLGSEPGEMMLNLGSNTLMPCRRGGGAQGDGSEVRAFFTSQQCCDMKRKRQTTPPLRTHLHDPVQPRKCEPLEALVLQRA